MTLRDTLRAVAQATERLEWDAWFPIARASATDPQELSDAVAGLDSEDQYALLDSLKTDGGPLADFLLCTLSSRPEVFADDQIRAYALADSTEALERRQQALTHLESSLREAIGGLGDRREASFNLAREITELERQRNALREDQLELGYQEMSEIEWDIARLQTFRARLQGYDAERRRSDRDELQAQASELEARRRSVEDEVASALVRRDASAHDLAGAEERHATQEREISDLLTRRDELTAVTESITAEIAALVKTVSAASSQVAALTEQRRQLTEELQRQQDRLNQLQSSPVADTAARLRAEIQDLYEKMPADEADAMFATAPRGSGR